MNIKKFEKNLKKFSDNWTKNPDLLFFKKLQKEFPKASVHLVGGMVRDLALGRESKDYDFVVGGVSGKKLQAFLQKHGEVNLVGKTFGVYKFKPSNKRTEEQKNKSALVTSDQLPAPQIDIALPRTEESFGTGAYRDFKIKSDYKMPIEEDLKRRDFTINAVALRLVLSMKYEVLSIIDPFHGLADLEKKLIRTVGKPEDRFKEDYSRMLRGIRFACQLDFEIHTTTWRAIKKHIKNINKKTSGEFIVPREIIAKELVKSFSKNPVWAMELLDKCGAILILIPELLKMKRSPQPKQFHTEGDVWQHTKLVLQKLYSKEFKKEFKLNRRTEDRDEKKFEIRNSKFEIPPEVVWSALFHDLGKPYTLTMTDRIRNNGHDAKGAKLFSAIADRLRLSSAGLDVLEVEKLVSKHMLPTQAKEMKERTIEKYFFNEMFPGKNLMKLIFADISATIPASGKPDFSSYKILKKRIEKLQKKAKKKTTLPKELLNGHEIMKILVLKPGKEVQRVKDYLREMQLTGKVKTKTQAKKIVASKFEARNPKSKTSSKSKYSKM